MESDPPGPIGEPPDPPAPSRRESDEYRGANPFGLVPLIILVVLVGGGLLLIFKMREMANIQDCAWSGRKNCTPIADPGTR